MDKTIVLVTGGKREDVDFVGVRVFDDHNEAKAFCDATNAESEGKKYWTRAEIIEPDRWYEPTREGLYDSGEAN